MKKGSQTISLDCLFKLSLAKDEGKGGRVVPSSCLQNVWPICHLAGISGKTLVRSSPVRILPQHSCLLASSGNIFYFFYFLPPPPHHPTIAIFQKQLPLGYWIIPQGVFSCRSWISTATLCRWYPQLSSLQCRGWPPFQELHRTSNVKRPSPLQPPVGGLQQHHLLHSQNCLD
jgi:hypothetical protein